MSEATNPDQINHLVGLTLQFLAVRNRSAKEVSAYINKKSGDNQSLADAVNHKISHFNLLNDELFAVNWTEMRHQQGKGPLVITAELKHKGIDQNLINQALATIPPNLWRTSAQNVVSKKIHSQKISSQAEKAKIYRYLYSRGFPSSTIYAVIDSLVAE
jgi:regulatory protein